MKFLNNSWKQAVATVVLVTALAAFTGCLEDDNNSDNIYLLSGAGSGQQQVPAVNTQGTASMDGSYNATRNILSYSISWSGLTGPASMIHFHGPAQPGSNAGIVLPLEIQSNGTSGTSAATVNVPDSLEQYLLSGLIYYNIHTSQYPDGEVRGQVIPYNN